MRALAWLGGQLARFLNAPVADSHARPASDLHHVARTIRQGDVLLVEGERRISTAIKYLTQSSWSHAAVCVTAPDDVDAINAPEQVKLIDADIITGVREVALPEFANRPLRICRPSCLQQCDLERVVSHLRAHLGDQYDLKNVLDLARYLFPTPPVPSRWRRRMIALGSGEPTRAICSTLIASAFQSVKYPILPTIEQVSTNDPGCPLCTRELWRVRHHSLFVPADFDRSPFFDIVKPAWPADFNYTVAHWN